MQRGHASLENLRSVASLPVRYGHFYPFEVQVRDTMCFAPAKQRTLAQLFHAMLPFSGMRGDPRVPGSFVFGA